MESAERFGMRQILAGCEHCIVQDTSRKFNNALNSVPPGSPQRTADCIYRMCKLRDDPIQTWSPEKFLYENLNYHKPWARCIIEPVDSGSTIR